MAGTTEDGWSYLLPEILLSILARMSCPADRIRFGAVCTWWRSVLAESRRFLPPTDPLLMLPYTEDHPHPRHVCGIAVRWVHWVLLPDSQIEPTLPPAEQKLMRTLRCHHRSKKVVFGSSMGWLFLDDCGVFSLWNPVTRAEIPLPSPAAVPVLFKTVKKAALSSDPDSEDCVVVALGKSSGTLSFCRVGDESWTVFGSNFDDVAFYRGQLYAVTCDGKVAACDVGPNPKLTQVATHDYNPEDDYDLDDYTDDGYGERDGDLSVKNYLVESSGELLKVTRIVELVVAGPNRDAFLTMKFVIHKLDVRAGTWSRVKSVGDRALFLGGSSSVSLAASEVHGGGGCMRNCIYFLDDYGCSDMGVFDIEDGSVSIFGIRTYGCSANNYYCSKYVYSPHFWISLAP